MRGIHYFHTFPLTQGGWGDLNTLFLSDKNHRHFTGLAKPAGPFLATAFPGKFEASSALSFAESAAPVRPAAVAADPLAPGPAGEPAGAAAQPFEALAEPLPRPVEMDAPDQVWRKPSSPLA